MIEFTSFNEDQDGITMVEKIKNVIKEYRNEFCLLLVFILIVTILAFSYLPKQKTDPYDGLFNFPESVFPDIFDLNQSHYIEGYTEMGDIRGEVYGHTEFHFWDDIGGGMTGSSLVLYNHFTSSKEIIIIHHFYIIAQYEISILKEENDSWEITQIQYEWLPPNETMPLLSLFDNHDQNIFQYPLIFHPKPTQSEFLWLDLGEFIVGGEDNSISGYNFISIGYTNDNAKDSSRGINILYNENFAIKKLLRFVIMDRIDWKINKGGSIGWENIHGKTIYLGNGIIEGDYGIENSSGILLTPYTISR